ncbi:MAG: hypothetical protein KA371_00270 [Acidobacteria bacterium]|nr:hypothetical protein [Acidobacteriota bacterium]
MADAATPPPLPTSAPPSSNRGVMIVLSYLWLLALVPLLVEKDDKEVQWHAKHGIVLMLAEIVFWVAVTIVQLAIGTLLGCVVGLLTFAVWIAIVVLHIIAIVKGVNGGRLIVPGVSQYADRM